MGAMENFEKFYEEKLRIPLEKLEKKRKKVAGHIKIAWWTFAALTLLVIVIYWHQFVKEPPLLFFPASVLAVLCILTYKLFKKNYRKNFKKDVVSPLVKFIDDSMEYDSKACIPKKIFLESRLFPSFNEYGGEDLVRGRRGETDFMFSELFARIARRDSKGNTRKTVVFEGVFFVSDFHKEFKGVTAILPQHVFETSDSAYREGFGYAVKLEDPEFEKEFNVFGSDQVESRYVLSTSLMKRIVDYKRRTGQVMSISFVNSKIFVAISWEETIAGKGGKFSVSTRKNLFEPPVFSPLKGFETASSYMEDVEVILDIIDDLRLNRRIWLREA